MSMPNIPDISPDIKITRDQSIDIVLSSIGMEELSLAHLVNAEAEKIQFSLGTLGTSGGVAASLSQIMETNNSAHKMLRDVIKNQMLLGMKMEDTVALALVPPVPLFTASDIFLNNDTSFPLSESVFNTLKDTTAFTLVSSIVPSDISGHSSIFSIGNSSPSIQNSHFHVFYEAGVVGIELRDETKGRLLDQRVSLPAEIIAPNTLVNIGFTASDTTGYKLFVNGILALSTPPTVPYVFIPDIIDLNNAMIGETQRGAAKAYPLRGIIKHIEIYDTTLKDAVMVQKTQ